QRMGPGTRIAAAKTPWKIRGAAISVRDATIHPQTPMRDRRSPSGLVVGDTRAAKLSAYSAFFQKLRIANDCNTGAAWVEKPPRAFTSHVDEPLPFGIRISVPRGRGDGPFPWPDIGRACKALAGPEVDLQFAWKPAHHHCRQNDASRD